MSEEEKTITVEENDIAQKNFNLEEFIHILISHWYWFVLAALIAVALAVYKVLKTTPMYQSMTTLLIKQQEGNASTQEFSDLGILPQKSNLSNEMQILQTTSIMQETVSRLHLDVQLSVPQRLHDRPLYNDAPALVTFGDGTPDNRGASFMMKIENGEKVRIYDFGGISSKALIVPFDTDVKTPVGRLRIAKSPAFKDAWVGQEIQVTKYPISALTDRYCARLNVSQSGQTGTILALTMVDEVPERASDLLLKLIEVYNDAWVADNNRVAESTARFITDRLYLLAQELGDVDHEIANFKSANLMPDVSAAAGTYMGRDNANFSQSLELNNQLSMAEYLENYISNSKMGDLLPQNTLGNAAPESLINSYNETMMKRNEMLANSSADNQYVQEYDKQLATQKTAIVRSLNNVISQLKMQLGNLQRTETENNAKISANPQKAEQLLSIERQQKVKESLYIYLLQKREENELSKAYTAWNTRVIQPPIGMGGPISPQKKKILIQYLLIAMAIPTILLFLNDFFNKTVRGRKDLDGMTVPLIGEVPTLTKKLHWWQKPKRVKRQLVVETGNRNQVNESFRLVRTKLDFILGTNKNDTEGKVIMFTSYNPSSGKTFISANLSRAFALRGKRVAAVDLDLRRCSLSQMLSTKATNSLSSYLSGQEDDPYACCVKNGFGEGVDVFPTSIIPPNPTELLLSERIRELFESLRSNYDYRAR